MLHNFYGHYYIKSLGGHWDTHWQNIALWLAPSYVQEE